MLCYGCLKTRPHPAEVNSIQWLSETSVHSASPLSLTQTHHTTPVTDEILSHVTITDPVHPLFQCTLPVIRRTLWRGKPYLVMRLATGRTRSVPLAATNEEPMPQLPGTSRLLPISARTLLPVARHLQLMALAKEGACHDTSSPLTPDLAAGPRRGGGNPTATGARSASAHAVRATPGRPHSTPAYREHNQS